MAWATPATAVTGAVAEAADFNNHRDDLNETAPAKATTAGDIVYATGANAIARLAIGTEGQELVVNSAATAPLWMTRSASTQDVTAAQTTTSTSYTDLATTGPAVTLSPGITKAHLLLYKAEMYNDAGDFTYASPSIAGAAAVDVDSAWVAATAYSSKMMTTLAASQASGATHTIKYKNGASGTGYFRNRRIVGVVI